MTTARRARREPVIPLLEVAEAKAAAEAAGISEMFAGVNLFRTTLRQPCVAQIWGTTVEKMMFGGALDARLRELVVFRVLWVTDGESGWANHYPYAKSLGVTDPEILAVRHWQDGDPALSDDDRLVLGVVDDALRSVRSSPETIARVHAIVGGDGAMMELLMIPGLYLALSTLTENLGFPLDEGNDPWLPDGVPPRP